MVQNNNWDGDSIVSVIVRWHVIWNLSQLLIYTQKLQIITETTIPNTYVTLMMWRLCFGVSVLHSRHTPTTSIPSSHYYFDWAKCMSGTWQRMRSYIASGLATYQIWWDVGWIAVHGRSEFLVLHNRTIARTWKWLLSNGWYRVLNPRKVLVFVGDHFFWRMQHSDITFDRYRHSVPPTVIFGFILI